MTLPTMNTLRSIYPLMVEQYETFIPNIEGMDITQKTNSIIQYLNRIGKLNNDVVTDWNKVMKWVMDEGLTDTVNTKVDDLIAKGTFDDLLQTMFDEINVANTSFQNTINTTNTTFQNTINGQVNTLTTSLAESTQQINSRDVNVMYPPAPLVSAIGDGVINDAPAIQAAINYANGGTVIFPKPPTKYLISSTITNVSGKKIIMRSMASNQGVTIKADNNFSGYMFQLDSGFDLKDIILDGNKKDGCYGIGSTTASSGNNILDNVIFTALDYGIKFDGTAQFPINASFKNVWMYYIGTAGIKIAADTLNNGQSSIAFDNVTVTNLGTPSGIQASGVVITRDVTTTTDKIDWSSTGAKEYGWIIMQRLQGSTDKNAWVQAGQVNQTTTTFTVTKTAGQQFDYIVIRHTIGIHLKYLKGVSFGTVQCEYMGTGMRLRECIAVKIGTFYTEWRGNTDNSLMLPRGDGLDIQYCSAVDISAIWAENPLSALKVSYSLATKLGTAKVLSANRSVIYSENNAENQSVSWGNISCDTTPVIFVTSDKSTISYEGVNADVSDYTNYFERTVSHKTLSKYTTRYRGNVKATLGADANGGYISVNRANLLPVASTSVENNSIFMDSTDNLLKYKDNSGAVTSILPSGYVHAFNHTIAFSVPSSTWTKLTFDTTGDDKRTEFVNSTYTAKTAGIKNISFGIQWGSLTTGNRNRVAIYKNGSPYAYVADTTEALSFMTQSGSIPIYLSVNDTVEIYVYSTNAVTTQSGDFNTWVNIG